MKSVSALRAALVLLLTCFLSFCVEASQSSLRARSDKVLVSDGAESVQHSVSSKDVKANQKDDAEDAADDDDDDEDDDDEQDDEESDKAKAPAYETKAAAKRTEAAPSKGEEEEGDLDVEDDFNKILHPHAKEKAAMQKSIRKIEEELASNLKKQAELKTKLSFFLNHKESDAQIDTEAKQVANETESVAMATMLAKMWKEMRMFEVPAYAKHAEEERQQLKSEEKALEKKLRDEQAKLAEAEKKWAKAAAKEKDKEHGSADAEVAKAEKEVQGAANQVAPGSARGWKEYAVYQDFWSLNSRQQRSVLEGTLIYLLFGILVAYLYHLAVAKYPKAFSPSQSRTAIPKQSSFTFSLFGCFQDKTICALGCCCPCLRWSQTLDKANLLAYFKAFAVMYFCMLIHPFTGGLSAIGIVVLGVVYRQKLRAKYSIERHTTKTVCEDIATWIFCQPCAVCQEAREEAVTRGQPTPRAPMV